MGQKGSRFTMRHRGHLEDDEAHLSTLCNHMEEIAWALVGPPRADVLGNIMNIETEVAALEREWMEAWCRKDRHTCERLLADDFLLTSARGVLMSKTEWLTNAIGLFVCDAFHWEEIQVRPLAADVAVVHARTRQQARVGAQDWSGVFLITDVWVKRRDQWQVVARHGTGPLPEPRPLPESADVTTAV